MAQDQNSASNGSPRRKVAARVHPGLDAALAHADRMGLHCPHRLVVRAAICYNYGDADGWMREMADALAIIRSHSGLSHEDFSRALQTPTDYLTRHVSTGDN